MEQQPSVGRIVHYVDNNGIHNAALIISVEEEFIVLKVFTPKGDLLTEKMGSDEYSKIPDNFTWHWPEKV